MRAKGLFRNLLIAGLLLLTVLLAGIAIFLAINLNQQDQAPEDTAAFGFGEEAVTTNFGPVRSAIENTPCSFFLAQADLDGRNIDINLDDANSGSLTRSGMSMSKSCIFETNTDRVMIFHIKGYADDETIAANRGALYSEINQTFFQDTSTLRTGRLFQEIDYFYGQPRSLDNNTDSCLLHLFHVQNDFEYASVSFSNLNCEENEETIIEIAAIFSEKINKLMLPFRIEDIQFENEQ